MEVKFLNMNVLSRIVQNKWQQIDRKRAEKKKHQEISRNVFYSINEEKIPFE